MKICFLVDSYKPIYDGVVRYFDSFIPALVAEGHEVVLVCPHIPGTKKIEYPHKGLKVVRCFNPGFYDEGYYIGLPDYNLIKSVREADFVLIHSLATLGVIGGFVARFYRKKIGLFAHQDERIVLSEMLHRPNWIVNFTISLISEIFYPYFVDVFFCATERFKGKLLDYKVPEKKIFFTPFAIDSKTYRPGNITVNIRERHNIPQDAIVTIFVGRISIEKNITNLITALDDAMDEEPKLYSLFVGKKTHHDLIPPDLKHADRMIFTGFVPEEELPSYYCSVDIFVSPSLHESSCFTIFEAMSCQLPVITSEYRHDKDIIHKENAVLVKQLRNPNAIKEAILYLVRDEKARKYIALNGKQLIDTRTWQYHVHEFFKGVRDVYRKSKSKSQVRIFFKQYFFSKLKKKDNSATFNKE
ncbi:MAG TPA: glycosyltransferase family 4 protein [Candidatus Bathyarchaeia archaeon]|nr:glycosyltransferase family 4 protein [Candidatus Bathyarchaeia archaeon]